MYKYTNRQCTKKQKNTLYNIDIYVCTGMLQFEIKK